MVDVIPTPRMGNLTMSWNMQGDGSAVVVGFSLTGEQISFELLVQNDVYINRRTP